MNGERQRQMILEALRSAHDGLDTNQLAERLDLHPNTIRWHLGLLTDAGLVHETPERRHGRGRPSIVHCLTGEGIARGRDEYRLLATVLTEVVAGDRDGEARAYEAGVRWGRHLQQGEPEAGIADLLDQEGFAAEQHGDRVEMRRCPFYALAEGSPQVICTLHHGIIDGALAEAGSEQTVDRLDPFVEPGLCIAHLSPEAQQAR
ncbi:MAG TPA: helix-turn-helix domain-containing protein [Gaiellaceae bacterium]|nr:helix-turn-helix domain-containing protein [Gaiellaceae bacterium]